MKVRLTPLAAADLGGARDHYAAIDPRLATGFLTEFDGVLERLELFPNGAPPVEGFPDLRRARMRRFPYGVFYRLVANDGLEVVRVLHAKQEARD